MGLRTTATVQDVMYGDNGKENGNSHKMGLYWDNGKENGNYYNEGMLGLGSCSEYLFPKWPQCSFPVWLGSLFFFKEVYSQRTWRTTHHVEIHFRNKRERELLRMMETEHMKPRQYEGFRV